MGVAPGSLLPTPRTVLGAQRACASVADHVPMVNVTSFGMCRSLANPVVASATSAASGVLTPMPCVPATPSPWVPGSTTVLLAGMPTLCDSATLSCLWAGTISIVQAGQTVLTAP
jgi:hypothetical protein